MKRSTSSLSYIYQRQRIEQNISVPAVVFLHGRGADENDLIGLAEYFDDRLFIISVRAPFPSAQGIGYTWFDIEDIGRPDIAMFNESMLKLKNFLAELPELFPVDSKKIILCGFSMGAMMSYCAALTEPERIFGVIGLSGLIPEGDNFKFNWEKIEKKPFFIAHGIHDSVIPVSFGRRAKELLTRVSCDVTYREYDMDHQISEETVGDLIKWVTNLLDNTGH